jgi:cell division protein FtsQ
MAKKNRRNREKLRPNRRRLRIRLRFKEAWQKLRESWGNRSLDLSGVFSRIMPYVVVAVLAAVIPMLIIHGYRFVMQSPNFNVKHVRVEGQNRLSVAEVMEAAGVARGPNLLALEQDLVAARLVKHPWIKSAKVARELPDRLVITVREREPVAQLALGALYLVDRKGEVFKRVEAGENFDWPVFTGLVREDLDDDAPDDRAATVRRLIRGAISLLESWRRIDRSNMMPLAEVHLDPLFGFSVVLAGNSPQGAGAVIHLGMGELSPKIDKLAVVLADARRRGVSIASVRLDDERDPNRVAVRFRGADQSEFDRRKSGALIRAMASGEEKTTTSHQGNL